MAQQKEALPSEESQQLLAATQVAGLSPAELDVLRKFFYEERDMREIAQEMRISLRGAYVIKDRALKKLRRRSSGRDSDMMDFPLLLRKAQKAAWRPQNAC